MKLSAFNKAKEKIMKKAIKKGYVKPTPKLPSWEEKAWSTTERARNQLNKVKLPKDFPDWSKGEIGEGEAMLRKKLPKKSKLSGTGLEYALSVADFKHDKYRNMWQQMKQWSAINCIKAFKKAQEIEEENN